MKFGRKCPKGKTDMCTAGLLTWLIICFITLVLSVPCYAGGETFKGHIVSTKGKTIVATQFEFRKYHEAPYEYEGQSIKVPFKDMKRVSSLGHNWYLLEKRNGKQFKVKGHPDKKIGVLSTSGGPGQYWLLYHFYDPVNEAIKLESIYVDDIQEVVFDTEFGELRKCPKCSRTFPPDYVYCPYDRSEMRLTKIK